MIFRLVLGRKREISRYESISNDRSLEPSSVGSKGKKFPFHKCSRDRSINIKSESLVARAITSTHITGMQRDTPRTFRGKSL